MQESVFYKEIKIFNMHVKCPTLVLAEVITVQSCLQNYIHKHALRLGINCMGLLGVSVYHQSYINMLKK